MNQPNSVWRKVLTDRTSGAVLDVGRTQYRPPQALADLVHARDRECRMPGCHRPAFTGDIDHHQPWAKDGETNTSNLDCYCRYHHRLKDQPGWHYNIDPETGEFTVTTPTSRHYRSNLERNVRPQQLEVEKSDHAVPAPRPWLTHRSKSAAQSDEPAPFQEDLEGSIRFWDRPHRVRDQPVSGWDRRWVPSGVIVRA